MNEDVMRFVALRALTRDEADSKFETRLKEYEKTDYPQIGIFIVRLKACRTFIGLAHLIYDQDASGKSASVGYGLMPEFWGKGYATEILGSLIRQSRRLEKLKQLTAEVHPDNKASIKILLNQGFASSHKTIEDDGEPTEHYVLVLPAD